MKRIIAIGVVLALCLCLLTSCYPTKRVVQPISAGSSVLMYGAMNETYKIKELDLVSENGAFFFEDYYVSDQGRSYEITKGSKVVASVCLASKSETYNQQVYEFNLDTYKEFGITITSEMDYVRIVSSSPDIVHDLVIIVDYERTKPCDIEFVNVNIQTSQYISVLTNYSLQPMNLKFTGENYFKAGMLTNVEEYYNALKQSEVGTALVQAATPLAYSGKYFQKRAIKVYLNTLIGNGTFEENFFSTTKDLVDIIDKGLTGLDTLLNNRKGEDGFDGMATVVSFAPVYLYGEGKVTIIGGNGTNGEDARAGFVGSNDVSGGKGGDAGLAITAKVLVEYVGGGAFFSAGHAGSGGEGAGFHGGSKGPSGSREKDFETTYYYKKR